MSIYYKIFSCPDMLKLSIHQKSTNLGKYMYLHSLKITAKLWKWAKNQESSWNQKPLENLSRDPNWLLVSRAPVYRMNSPKISTTLGTPETDLSRAESARRVLEARRQKQKNEPTQPAPAGSSSWELWNSLKLVTKNRRCLVWCDSNLLFDHFFPVFFLKILMYEIKRHEIYTKFWCTFWSFQSRHVRCHRCNLMRWFVLCLGFLLLDFLARKSLQVEMLEISGTGEATTPTTPPYLMLCIVRGFGCLHGDKFKNPVFDRIW